MHSLQHTTSLFRLISVDLNNYEMCVNVVAISQFLSHGAISKGMDMIEGIPSMLCYASSMCSSSFSFSVTKMLVALVQ